MTERPPLPGAVVWYRVYAALMAAVYVFLFLGVAAALAFAPRWLPTAHADMPDWFMLGYLGFLMVMSVGLGGLFIASFFLPRSPGAWLYHIILICLGMSSACFLPLCLPLLLFWLQDPCKAYFGKD